MGVTPLTTEMLAVASMDIFSNPHTSAACGPRAGEGVIRMEFSTVDVRSCGFVGLGRLVRSIMSASRERRLQCVVEVGNDVNQAISWL
jgi:hypothetical protein